MGRLLVLGVMASCPAFALAGSPDFSGTWTLSTERSSPMDPILELQDVPWAVRVVAGDLDRNAVIRQQADRMTIHFDNWRGELEQVLLFDGQPHTTVNPAGLPTTFSTRWEGEVLVSEGPADIEGEQALLRERRTLSADGREMTVVVELTAPSGASASARRVFEKQ